MKVRMRSIYGGHPDGPKVLEDVVFDVEPDAVNALDRVLRCFVKPDGFSVEFTPVDPPKPMASDPKTVFVGLAESPGGSGGTDITPLPESPR